MSGRAKPLDRKRLELALVDLAFEFYHFEFDERWFLNSARIACPGERQAIQYSWLTHLRVLIDFFYTRPKHDDIVVSDFCMLPDFSAHYPHELLEQPEWVEKMRIHLNKRLAHLTATRQTPGPKMDYYTEGMKSISSLIPIFENALPEELAKVIRHERAKYEQRDKKM
jgi:hypothetical protein